MNSMITSAKDGLRTAVRPAKTRPCLVTPEDESELQLAIEDYKKRSGRQFPTWSEILEILVSLGYAKRIWRPVDSEAPTPLETPEGSGHFQALEDDPTSDLRGWYSWVETPARF